MDYTIWGHRELVERVEELERAIPKIVSDIVSGGALCMDSEDDCRDFARQFADGIGKVGESREAFARACGFDGAADMDTPRDEE